MPTAYFSALLPDTLDLTIFPKLVTEFRKQMATFDANKVYQDRKDKEHKAKQHKAAARDLTMEIENPQNDTAVLDLSVSAQIENIEADAQSHNTQKAVQLMHKTTSDSVGLPIESNQYSKREKRKRKNGGGSGASSSSQDGSSAISILSGEHKQKQLRRHGNVNKPSNEVGTDDNAAVSSDTFTEPQIAQLTHLIRAVNGTTAPTTQSATHPPTKRSKSRSRDTSSKTKRKNGKCSLLPGEIQITSNNAGGKQQCRK